MGGTRQRQPMIREVVHAYAHRLGASTAFPGHPFGRSKMPKSQKMAKNAENARNANSTNEYGCGIGHQVKGMETISKAGRPCQRLGDHAKGVEIIPQASIPCQRHEDHPKGMEIIPKVW